MEKDDRLDLFLCRWEELMGRLSREVHARLDQHLPAGLTHNQFLVCRHIHRHGRATVSEMAEAMGVSLSAITATADRLCEAGMLRRERDPADRRLVWLSLTEKNRAMMDKVLQRWQETLKSYFGRLPVEDLEYMVTIIEKLLGMIQSQPAKKA